MSELSDTAVTVLLPLHVSLAKGNLTLERDLKSLLQSSLKRVGHTTVILPGEGTLFLLFLSLVFSAYG